MFSPRTISSKVSEPANAPSAMEKPYQNLHRQTRIVSLFIVIYLPALSTEELSKKRYSYYLPLIPKKAPDAIPLFAFKKSSIIIYPASKQGFIKKKAFGSKYFIPETLFYFLSFTSQADSLSLRIWACLRVHKSQAHVAELADALVSGTSD
jgi:hypothetical protein